MDLSSIKGVISVFPPWMLLGLGFVTGWLRSFWQFFYSHTVLVVEKKIKIGITIEEQDHKEAFVWINTWMESRLRKKKIAYLRLDRKMRGDDYNSKREEYHLVPGYGFYYLWWKKKLITFESSKKEAGGESDYGGSKLIRTITLEIWGTRNRSLLYDIIAEAKDEFEKSNPKVIKYYVHKSDYWDDLPLRDRPLDTVYLPEDQLKDILADFEKFYKHEDRYRSLGIPYRRGYLFEGPPGSGKTTLVQCLASHFKTRIYFVNLTSGINASTLSELLNDCVSPCIVLMEDVDCVGAAQSREGKKNKEQDKELNPIRTNELLNILDGLVASEERVVIMTTNHPDKLDKALLRAGRVDRRFHIGYSEDPELLRFHNKAQEFYDIPDFYTFRKMLPAQCTIADAQSKVFEISNLTNVEKDDISNYASK